MTAKQKKPVAKTKKPKKQPVERKKHASPDARVTIMAKIESGLTVGTTLRSMCREEGMPSYGTVYNWIKESEEIIKRIACAREAGYDAIAEDILQIADDSTGDIIIDEDGKGRANNESVARSRLRVDARLKLLAKWSPKKYGDKIAVGGAADLPPIQVEDVSDIDLARQIAAVLSGALAKAQKEAAEAENNG